MAGGVEPASNEPPTMEELERVWALAAIERSMRNIKPLTPTLMCIVANRGIAVDSLQHLGLSAVQSSSEAEFDVSRAEAVLVVSVGIDTTEANAVVERLNQHRRNLAIFVIVMVPLSGTGDNPTESLHIAGRMAANRGKLCDLGADDVMYLFGSEELTVQRLVECYQRMEYIETKITSLVREEAGAAEERAARKMQSAHKKFLMMLPGRVFENLPVEDTHLEEMRADSGRLVGVGDFMFQEKLGAGAFGHVFKAHHPEHGIVAVKVVSKRSIKNANMLFSLDREVGQTLHGLSHPNIVKSKGVLHGVNNFYVVMEYGGRCNILRFVKHYLDRHGGSVLPQELATNFAKQQAGAVAHLHKAMVCHRDIKPDNWIVADDGPTLKLGDFGLSMQLCGPTHTLRQSCGSLPFCAPEVFNSDFREVEGDGYDGYAADVWSVAVGYMELLAGPYSVERALGWLPQHPGEHADILAGLQSLESLWIGMYPEYSSTAMARIVSLTLLLDPSARLKISEVLGAKGFGAALAPSPPRTQAVNSFPRSRKSRLSSDLFGSGKSRQSSDSGGGTMLAGSAPLIERLGGPPVLVRAVNQMFDSFLFAAGYGEAFVSCPMQASELRSIYIKELHPHFEGSDFLSPESEKRLQEAHSKVLLFESHFDLMCELFGTALGNCRVDAPDVEEAVAKLSHFKGPAIDFAVGEVAREARKNTPEWRASVLNAVTPHRIRGFSHCLRRHITDNTTLRKTPIADMDASALERWLVAYLGGEGAPITPVRGLSQEEHLVFVNLARDALAVADFSADVRYTLHVGMLQEWSLLHRRRRREESSTSTTATTSTTASTATAATTAAGSPVSSPGASPSSTTMQKMMLMMPMGPKSPGPLKYFDSAITGEGDRGAGPRRTAMCR